MAKQVVERLIDDLDGSDAVESIEFAFGGATYEIDLNEKNAGRLRADFSKWTEKARRTGGQVRRGSGRPSAKGVDLNAVRVWAREQGYTVSDRGRVPAAIMEQYRSAHKGR